jgi:hypothetical protein
VAWLGGDIGRLTGQKEVVYQIVCEAEQGGLQVCLIGFVAEVDIVIAF